MSTEGKRGYLPGGVRIASKIGLADQVESVLACQPADFGQGRARYEQIAQSLVALQLIDAGKEFTKR